MCGRVLLPPGLRLAFGFQYLVGVIQYLRTLPTALIYQLQQLLLRHPGKIRRRALTVPPKQKRHGASRRSRERGTTRRQTVNTTTTLRAHSTDLRSLCSGSAGTMGCAVVKHAFRKLTFRDVGSGRGDRGRLLRQHLTSRRHLLQYTILTRVRPGSNFSTFHTTC